MERIYSHIVDGANKPVVMAFPGPDGHGKTELALKLDDLLFAKHILVDAAQLKNRSDLLGPSMGYHGSGKGPVLNNFIAENNGKRAIVFLDEFDKTTQEIRK
jgi:ATP-dependent Clp protease ATP-binding subunit ClpA